MKLLTFFEKFIPDHKDISEALCIAQKKSQYIGNFNPLGEAVKTENKKETIFWGKLGDFGVSIFITQKWKVKVEDYDKVRTDGFKYPDQWDLRILHNESEYLGEVRTSNLGQKILKNYRERVQYIYDHLRLLDGYVVSNFKKEEAVKDIYFQVVYPYTKKELNRFFKLIEDGKSPYFHGLICGYALREDFDKIGHKFKYGNSLYKAIEIKKVRYIGEKPWE